MYKLTNNIMAPQHSVNTGDSNLDDKIIEWLQWNKV